MNSSRYESFLIIASSYLALIVGLLGYIVTQEKWFLILCVLCALGFSWLAEQANKRALIAEREK